MNDTTEPDTMAGNATGDADLDTADRAGLVDAVEAVGSLLDRVRGPLRHLRLAHGSTSVELSWPDEPSTPGGTAEESPTAPQPAGAMNPSVGIAVVDVPSPLVGAVYRAPEPGAAPFVAPGDHVVSGQQVLIVEAMKLMNSVDAPVDGTVSEILVADGETVEYEQILLRIVPDEVD